MNHSLIETVMAALIFGYVFMGAVFFTHQRQGQSFIASFDKAMVWGGGLFVVGCCLSTAAYFA